jgi:hypothetical protein
VEPKGETRVIVLAILRYLSLLLVLLSTIREESRLRRAFVRP